MALITNKKLKNLKPESAGLRLNDGESMFGVVKVNIDGSVSVPFTWRFRHEGKLKDFACGTYPKVTLAQIRANRNDAERVLETGIDPRMAKKAEKLGKQVAVVQEVEKAKAELAKLAADAIALKTVRDLFGPLTDDEADEERFKTSWLKTELAQRKDKGAELRRAWIKDVLPAIGDMPIRAVDTDHVLEITSRMKSRDAVRLARRTFGEIRQFFAWAYRRKLVDADPTLRVQKSKEFKADTERDRVLSEKEIQALAIALPDAGLKDATRLAIWIMLATLARVGELSKAEWDNVDLKNKRWRIPALDSKNGKEHVVVLSDFAVARFEELKKISGHRKFCYPSPTEEASIDSKTIGKQIKDRQRETPLKNRANKDLCGALLIGKAGWTPHDLRRTGATLMGELGITGDVIEKCLNHTEERGLRRIYQHQRMELEQAEAWQKLGDRLTLLSSKSNVVVGNFKQA